MFESTLAEFIYMSEGAFTINNFKKKVLKKTLLIINKPINREVFSSTLEFSKTIEKLIEAFMDFYFVKDKFKNQLNIYI
jgi:hypothetical protein